MKDYYKILELKQSASLDEIKKAYRALSKRYHPDVNKHGIEQFKAINEANSVLSDAIKRKAYDSKYNAHFKSKNTQQAAPTNSKQPNSNTSNSSTSRTIILNGVKINITGKNTSTIIRMVNGKVIVESTYH